MLLNEKKSAGNYTLRFDVNDLPNGMYVCKIQTANFVEIKKLVVIK